MLNATHEFAGRTAASPSSVAAVEAEVEAADQALFEDGCVFGITGIRIGLISVTSVGKIDYWFLCIEIIYLVHLYLHIYIYLDLLYHIIWVHINFICVYVSYQIIYISI